MVFRTQYYRAKYGYRLALGATQDEKLIDETQEFIMTKARDQDVIYYLAGLAGNSKARRTAADFVMKNYDAVSVFIHSQTGSSKLIFGSVI